MIKKPNFMKSSRLSQKTMTFYDLTENITKTCSFMKSITFDLITNFNYTHSNTRFPTLEAKGVQSQQSRTCTSTRSRRYPSNTHLFLGFLLASSPPELQTRSTEIRKPLRFRHLANRRLSNLRNFRYPEQYFSAQSTPTGRGFNIE